MFARSRIGYAMGTYEMSIPIAVPPARNGLTPKVGLEYQSTRELSRFGTGWRLMVTHVRRSLRDGTPRYVGPSGAANEDPLEFELEGTSATLVHIGVSRARTGRPAAVSSPKATSSLA